MNLTKKSILLIIFLPLIVYLKTFSNFFAQDDFILISYFSENNLYTDVINSFGLPKVTHWRPLHNLFFLVSGNLFGKSYQLYHLLSYFFHISAGILIFYLLRKITKDEIVATLSALIYVVHPAHFVSLNWISGSATTIGFVFLLGSILLFVKNNIRFSLFFYILALLASEAMLAGLIIFFSYSYIYKNLKSKISTLSTFTILSIVFFVVRLFWFTPKDTFDSYPVEINFKIAKTFQYYLTRIAGFSESGNDLLVSILLILWLILLLAIFVKFQYKIKVSKNIFFSVALVSIGLFPFIFLPNQLSAHYMNISVFGFSLGVASILIYLRDWQKVLVLVVFIFISSVNVSILIKNHWSTNRAVIAKQHILSIEQSNLLPETTIIFADSKISNSFESFISLGGGKALDFWFSDKNYNYCFDYLEKCEVTK